MRIEHLPNCAAPGGGLLLIPSSGALQLGDVGLDGGLAVLVIEEPAQLLPRRERDGLLLGYGDGVAGPGVTDHARAATPLRERTEAGHRQLRVLVARDARANEVVAHL